MLVFNSLYPFSLYCSSLSGSRTNVWKYPPFIKFGLPTIGFLGEGGSATDLVDIALSVPSKVTHKIQELHINLYHFYCMEIERLLPDLVT